MSDRTGQHLGNYRLLRLLGKGGFAEVYLGEHTHLTTQAAIKVLLAHLGSQSDVEGFRQEAQIIARLTHPHIVRVLDFDVEQGVPFLVMEYAPHGSLRTRHPRGQSLPLPLILSYVQQVASALQYAHEHRLIHRDVKPDNMLLHEERSVVLSDFGIVTIAHSTSSRGIEAMAGTPAYMAPEQMQGEPRAASDQYALAVSVYEWLTGKPPFQGTAMEVAMQHAMKPPASLRTLVPTLSPEIERVVLTALAKDPKERFATIQEFATALSLAVQSEQDASTFIKPGNRRSTDSSPTAPATLAAPPTHLRSTSETQNTAPPLKTIPPTLPIEHTLLPTGGATTPSVRQQVFPPIDGREVLRSIRRGDIPSNWRVFSPPPGKVLRKAVLTYIVQLFYLLLLVLFLLFVAAANWSNLQPMLAANPNLFLYGICGFIIVGALLSLVREVVSARKNGLGVLVLLPEGLVYGRRDKQEPCKVINFQDVTEFKAQGAHYTLKHPEQPWWGGITGDWPVDISWFSSPREVVLSLQDRYVDFQKTVGHP